MGIRFIGSLILFSIMLFGCNTSDGRRARALELLNEVNQISGESSEGLKSGNIQAAIARLDEYKKTFPDHRAQIRNDAQMVKESFEKEIAIDQKTEEKLGEVLTLGPSKEDADCIKSRIKFQQLLTRRIQSYVSELKILLDESVVDQKILQRMITPFQEKGAQLNLQASELQKEISKVCSKSSFKVN